MHPINYDKLVLILTLQTKYLQMSEDTYRLQ
jgi:hypothetical protein